MTNFKNDDDDEQELPRDGEQIRVPLLMMDALQRDVRDHFQTRTLDAASHRPGYRTSARATKDQLADANENWRKPGSVELLVRDAGIDAARETIIDSYEAYDRELCERYRTADVVQIPAGAFPTSAGAGNPCTINGAPGTLVAEAGYLVCKPTSALKPTSTDSMPAVDAREQVYAEYDRRTADAWRGDRNV